MKIVLETNRTKFEETLEQLPLAGNYRLVAYAGQTPEHGVYTGSVLRWEDANSGGGYDVGVMSPAGNFGSVVVTVDSGWVNKAYLGQLVEALA